APNVGILAEYNGRIVFARQGNLLACSFHPELSQDLRVHQYFLDMID
ncbi:MAG: pyridoxal 5'-phosphate synthase glutaminase subunit PdxT, partial [Desulfosporosinus sp.]